MEIGDKVKPVDTFDFDYNGPKTLDEIGTVVGFDHEGDPRVKWADGTVDIHITPESEFHLMFVSEEDEGGPFSRFGVVPV